MDLLGVTGLSMLDVVSRNAASKVVQNEDVVSNMSYFSK